MLTIIIQRFHMILPTYTKIFIEGICFIYLTAYGISTHNHNMMLLTVLLAFIVLQLEYQTQHVWILWRNDVLRKMNVYSLLTFLVFHLCKEQ